MPWYLATYSRLPLVLVTRHPASLLASLLSDRNHLLIVCHLLASVGQYNYDNGLLRASGWADADSPLLSTPSAPLPPNMPASLMASPSKKIGCRFPILVLLLVLSAASLSSLLLLLYLLRHPLSPCLLLPHCRQRRSNISSRLPWLHARRLPFQHTAVAPRHGNRTCPPTGTLLCHSTASSSKSVSSSASTSLHSYKQQVDVLLKAYVARVCFKCFKCFRGMLQEFHTDVAKLDRDVAYVAIAVHVCCKCLF
jgi:hypothetical protein